MEFYKGLFGGEVTYMMRDDKPELVMHADLKGGIISFMASDGDRTEPYKEKPITLSISGNDEELITNLFNKLAEGGEIESPLKKEAWGDVFGTVTDKFNVDWMVNISAN